MQWWCAATAQEWSWTWRAYPGVWLMVLVLAISYLRSLGRADGQTAGRAAPPWRFPVSFFTGLLFLWAMFDWPVGTLGTGYLLSVHTTQYVVLTLVAMPLLLAGIPDAAWPAPASGPAAALLEALGSPVLGLGLYTVAMVVTHIPALTDSLRQSQLGSFGVDMIWLAGGFALWWPVLSPPGYVRMSPPLRIGYLFLATIPPMIPAGFMVFAQYPLYSLYELAPRVNEISAGADQKTAGVIMKGASDPLIWLAMIVIFAQWRRAEGDADLPAAPVSRPASAQDTL
jgi:putative membrane protein